MKTIALSALAVALCIAALIAPGARAATVTSNIAYGSQSWQTLDVYRPASGTALPMIVFVHGGSWTSGNAAGLATQSQQIADAGFVVVTVNYRLATSSLPGYPQQVNDVKQATKWAVAHAASIGGNPARVGLLGASAGATLVLLATNDLNKNVAPGYVRATATLSAPVDLYGLAKGALASGGDGSGSGLPEFLGCPLASCTDSQLKTPSPTYRSWTGTRSQLYVMHSEGEFLPVQMTRDFVTKAQAQGIPVQTDYLPGTAHAMSYWATVSDSIIAYFKTKLA